MQIQLTTANNNRNATASEVRRRNRRTRRSGPHTSAHGQRIGDTKAWGIVMVSRHGGGVTPQGWGVVGKDDQLGLARPKRLEGRLVA